jgi:hypothetical protein
VFVQTTKSKAAAAVRIGAALAVRERAELLAALRPCFARTEPWLQAGKYVSALRCHPDLAIVWRYARRQAGLLFWWRGDWPCTPVGRFSAMAAMKEAACRFLA